jgi:prepilin peptidase CpaA
MTMDFASVAALLLASVACWTDLRTRRIPNVLTFGAAAAGLAFHAFFSGSGPLTALAGWFTGVLIFAPLFVLRGMGAGDLKLLGALGAWLGPLMAIRIGLWSAVAGGVLAVVVALAHGYASQALRNVWLLLTHWRFAGLKPLDSLTLDKGKGPRLAYAVPLMVGLMVALWTR